MRRILHILEALNMNGTESFIMNVFRNINRDEIMFDFLVSRRTYSEFEKEAESLGGNIYMFVPRRQGWRNHIKSLDTFFKENARKFAGVHVHGNSFTAMMPLAMATKYNMPLRIAHCHSTTAQGLHNKILHQLNRLRISRIANHYIACSSMAKEYGFGSTPAFREAEVIPNGINIDAFRFDADARNAIRQEFNVGARLVIGNVGGFREAKNHYFMLKIMKEILKTDPEALMWFIGDGTLRHTVEAQIRDLGLTRNVMVLGSRFDIPRLLSAMDIFLFPSKYEGLGIVALEAQAAGLPIVASTAIPPETNLTPLIQYLPLNRDETFWAEKILEIKRPDRKKENAELQRFNIRETVRRLTEVYLS